MQFEDRQRFTQMAEDYDQMAPYLLPMYDFLQQEMIRQAQIASLAPPRIVDLGSGSGRFIEKVLMTNPQASCYWVDSSEAFLEVARRRLARFADQVTFIVSPIEGNWNRQIAQPVDGIFSMSAIHHLEREEKRGVYAECFKLLKPGGWFINTDEMQSLDRQAYRNSLHFWVDYVDGHLAAVPTELAEHARQWRQHFECWKRRNIDGLDLPKTKGDDMHDPFLDQAQWLKEIGFTDVDVYVKYHLWCAVGGRRPHVMSDGQPYQQGH